MKRRALLLGAAGAGGTLLIGCGGSGGQSTLETGSPLPDALSAVWDPSPWMWFIAGQSRTIDLADTLPAEVLRGGLFGLASGGAPLPPRFVLSPAGLLTATDPAESRTANIVFTYKAPSA